MGLVDIGGGHTLRADAAASLARARRDGAPAGGVTSSTRTVARQQELYDHQGDPGWPALAERPAKSKHVWRPDDPKDQGARALDCEDPLRAWLLAHPDYGWRRTIPSELWHLEYAPALDLHTHDTTPEDDMAQTLLIAWQADGRQYVGDGITRRYLTAQARDDLKYQVGEAGIVYREVGRVANIDWLGVDVTPTEPVDLPEAELGTVDLEPIVRRAVADALAATRVTLTQEAS